MTLALCFDFTPSGGRQDTWRVGHRHLNCPVTQSGCSGGLRPSATCDLEMDSVDAKIPEGLT